MDLYFPDPVLRIKSGRLYNELCRFASAASVQENQIAITAKWDAVDGFFDLFSGMQSHSFMIGDLEFKGVFIKAGPSTPDGMCVEIRTTGRPPDWEDYGRITSVAAN